MIISTHDNSNFTMKELLLLEKVRGDCYRTNKHDANPTGDAFGGQVMGQAVMAAGKVVPEGRRLTSIQAVFLRGTRSTEPVDYDVSVLQAGRRFTSLRVGACQSEGRHCLDAQITFRGELQGENHDALPLEHIISRDFADTLDEIDVDWRMAIGAAGYPNQSKKWLDFRLVYPKKRPMNGDDIYQCKYWVRVRDQTLDEAHLRDAAIVYISDLWINFPSIMPHMLGERQRRQYNVVTLNHSLWMYGDGLEKNNEWLFVESSSSIAKDGRSLAQMYMYTETGSLVAKAVQECLLVEKS